MYQALYRKWRPKVFSDVIGQEHITETLKKQVAEGRTSHAYLFTGTRGTGKTTCAKILAKAVNCEHPVNGDPCCQCPSCIGLESGSFLDVLELDAASNNGVDQVRALRDEAIYAPANVKKRVYIVDEVHMLSTAAFNALLKILEEPPAHLMFILATTELHKVPATILSRCQRYSFKRILPKDIARRLTYVAQQEQIDLTPDGAELLSRLADGALRDGLSLLDQCAAAGGTVDSRAVLEVLGLAGNLQTAQLMQDILDRNAQAALLLVEVKQLQLQRGAFGDEVRFVANGQQCLFGQAGVGQHVLDVAGIEDGFDLVDVVVKHRQACARGLAQLLNQVFDRVVEVQAFDFVARDQDIVDRDVVQRMDA